MSVYFGNLRVDQEDNSALRSIAAVLCADGSLDWRHHGIGVLQAYIPGDRVPRNMLLEGVEHRLHIWSYSLIKPGIAESGDIHDHRFDMVSHVLFGALYNEEMTFVEHSAGQWTMAEVVHARKAGAENRFDAPTTALNKRYERRVAPYGIKAGERYYFPQRHFHSTRPHGFAITWVEKHNTDESSPARIAHPIDIPLVHAFGHEPDKEQVKRLVALAHEVLSS